MNSNNISYINNPLNTQFQQNATESQLQSIKMCNIQFTNITGWYDGESFDIKHQEWFDYSIYKNNINSSNIVNNKIKLGLFYKYNNNLYIYGNKFDSIQMPLSLNQNNYTIITVARYNGNDRNTIFVSNNSKWIFGFKNNQNDIIYHNGEQFKIINTLEPTLIPINESFEPTFEPTFIPTSIYTTYASQKRILPQDIWSINVDSPKIFRAQQKTLYFENNIENNNNSIKWGINTLNTS
eukprot:59809_1